jgi:hypothetical protein
MALPAFNDNGDLPEGVHLASLDEIVRRFGTATPQRQNVTARLLRIHQLLLATGKLERLILYGSYVTVKAEPNDVDIFLVMAGDFDIDEHTGETRDLFSHIIAQRRFGASIFWVNRQTSFANVEDLIAGWQTKRDLTRRGIVEVQL